MGIAGTMKRRRVGLQGKWARVVNSLQVIAPSYEKASSRISLYEDRRMREETVNFAVKTDATILDLGAGPGTMSRLVAERGGRPVLLDVSRVMIRSSNFNDRVQGAFEFLPFRPEAFDAVVSGFALRDAMDLRAALSQVSAVLRPGGRFGFCDLGKPDSVAAGLILGFYLRLAPGLIGLASAGRVGLRYGSLFDTYVLVLRNGDLEILLRMYFAMVNLHVTQMGGSIVGSCIKK
jgi:demethylmenaquinone methyltransferase / 2-methoxy-6-polyprenyl-1,4-benzoquinol methylase